MRNVLPGQRLELSGRGGRSKARESVLIPAAAARSSSAIHWSGLGVAMQGGGKRSCGAPKPTRVPASGTRSGSALHRGIRHAVVRGLRSSSVRQQPHQQRSLGWLPRRQRGPGRVRGLALGGSHALRLAGSSRAGLVLGSPRARQRLRPFGARPLARGLLPGRAYGPAPSRMR